MQGEVDRNRVGVSGLQTRGKGAAAVRRSPIDNPCNVQRLRHYWTIGRVQPTAWAIWVLDHPASAKRAI